MIRVESATLHGVLKIFPDAFEDHRGEYVETYNEALYEEAGIDIQFVQDDYSRSVRNVLRGLHGDSQTWKLVSCPHGRFYLVVVNCDETTSEFCQWESFLVSDRNRMQVLIPPKFGNGHLILSATAIFQYKQSAYYAPQEQFSYRYDDPHFDIWWPIANPILSQRDEHEQGKFLDS